MIQALLSNLYVSIIAIILSCFAINYFADILGENLQIIAIKAKISPSARGVLLDGISSSMPEFLSSVIAALMVLGIIGEPNPDAFTDIGIGTIGGSAIFNILIIPFLSVLFVPSKKLDEIVIDKKAMIRDLIVYSIFVFILFIACYKFGELTPMIGVVMTVIYVLYGIYLATQSKHHNEEEFAKYSNHSIPFLAGKALLALVPIAFTVHIAIEATIVVGNYFHIPLLVMALVLNAAVTSIPDALLSVRSARNGELDASISNAVGSNSFDIAICLGFVIALARTKIAVDYQSISYVFVFLILSAIAYTTSFYFKVSKATKLLLLGATYAIFIGYLCYIVK